MISEKELSYIIKNRRSVYPNQYTKEDISDDFLKKLFDNANMAPTHRLTQPWRFKVIKGKNRLKLAEILSSIYILMNPKGKITRTKLSKIKQKGIIKVIIEHYLHVVFSLADPISVLAQGHVIATGLPDEIRKSPKVKEAYLGGESHA